jgi:hypothetical protein
MKSTSTKPEKHPSCVEAGPVYTTLCLQLNHLAPPTFPNSHHQADKHHLVSSPQQANSHHVLWDKGACDAIQTALEIQKTSIQNHPLHTKETLARS